ncbi:YkvA family protein [[Mycobacterium] nativiensis]|uniref:YkvA family protein n=1 Tax=[Mycobacterium] nativiensis TaxID=2855503 RepID=A0ABU5XXG8_9MYCO|nr:YkvA family protein [Mycolicibacter sp. MYC340]MEB3031706.1 YkvA family protein [Mycolicibacter sp. MYC340]
MPWWLDLLIGLAAAVGAAWFGLAVTLAVHRPRGRLLGETLRILPDMIRLLRRLAADRSLSRAVRIRLWLLLIYLASPIDIIPDFIPVLGYADDAIIAVVILRSVVRRAGIDAVRAQWPGTEDGFAALTRITGLTE